MDRMWAQWIRAVVPDTEPKRCIGPATRPAGAKCPKRPWSADAASNIAAECDCESSSEGEYIFMSCDQ